MAGKVEKLSTHFHQNSVRGHSNKAKKDFRLIGFLKGLFYSECVDQGRGSPCYTPPFQLALSMGSDAMSMYSHENCVRLCSRVTQFYNEANHGAVGRGRPERINC